MKINKLLRNSKSQGISITTIIVAVIALVVLIVLILIFTGKIRVFGEGIDNCAQRGGKCELSIDGKCPIDQQTGEDVYATIKNTDCEKNNQNNVCCVRIL